jgi:hypothetical protein
MHSRTPNGLAEPPTADSGKEQLAVRLGRGSAGWQLAERLR